MIGHEKTSDLKKAEWGGVRGRKTKTENSNQTIGYFGPPFSTRDFPEIVNFFDWLNSKNINFKKKIISRIDRDELRSLENKYLDKIKNDKIDMTSFLNLCLKNEILSLNVKKFNSYWFEVDTKSDHKFTEKEIRKW